MDPLYILIVFAFIYCAIFFLDTIFKSCSHYPYLYFLKNTGLQVEVLKISWFTTALNRSIVRWASLRPKLLDVWFSVGTWLSLALLPAAIYIIAKSTYDTLQEQNGSLNNKPTVMLEPMIPGVNLPLGDLGYYIFTLAISSIIHEFGHALSAVREDVHLLGIGLTVIFIMPIGYVYISSEQMQALTPRKQLRILCAGIWHNIILTLFAVLITVLLPYIMYPMYRTGHSVSVRAVLPNSPLLGPTGLQIGDQITALNDCPVTDRGSWVHCIMKAVKQPSTGYCIHTGILTKYGTSVVSGSQCCPAESRDHLCFESVVDDRLEPSCLPARHIVQESHSTCSSARDCPGEYVRCVTPLLANNTKLVAITRSDAMPVLFLGLPAEIYHTTTVSNYVPKYSLLSVSVPEVIERMCTYVATFSAGLAIVNIVPSFWFDGQHIALALTKLFLGDKMKHTGIIALSVTFFCTVTFWANIAFIIYKSVFTLKS